MNHLAFRPSIFALTLSLTAFGAGCSDDPSEGGTEDESTGESLSGTTSPTTTDGSSEDESGGDGDSTGGDGDWKSKVMNNVSSGFYQGKILGKDHASAGIRYYIEAIDALGNEGCLPDTDPCGQESWYFPLSAD